MSWDCDYVLGQCKGKRMHMLTSSKMVSLVLHYKSVELSPSTALWNSIQSALRLCAYLDWRILLQSNLNHFPTPNQTCDGCFWNLHRLHRYAPFASLEPQSLRTSNQAYGQRWFGHGLVEVPQRRTKPICSSRRFSYDHWSRRSADISS